MLARTNHPRRLGACYVYQLLFPNGKRYTGIAVNPARRLREHFAQARKGNPLPVYRAIRKYGADTVQPVVLLVASRAYCQEVEVALIAMAKGYNASTGGEEAPMLGVLHSAEARVKMRDAHVGVKQSAAWVERRVSTQRGARRSAESRQRMSDGQKRRLRTPEELDRMAVIARARVSTPEWKEKLRVAALARYARERAVAFPKLQE